MKKTLSLALVTAMTCLAAVITAAPAAGAAVPSYTGCLSPVLNTIYDVAPGDAPAHPPCLRPANMIRLSSGDLTSLAAGTGLTGGGDNGDLSVAIAPSYRLPQSCSAGQTTSWNGTDWACAGFASQAQFDALVALLGSAGTINDGSNPVNWTKLKGVPAGFADGTDDTGPAYAAGFGLNLAGATFSVDPTQVQRRVGDSCAAGSSIRAISQDGTVTCEGHSTYTAGEGLALSGSEFSVTDGGVTEAKLSFDPTTQAEFDSLTALISGPGTINDTGNPIEWTKLKSVPAGFADGTDDTGLASVSVGVGLTGSGAGGDPVQVEDSYRMPQSCSSAQVPKWNGVVWACGNDNEGNGGGGNFGHTPAGNDLSTLDSAGSVGFQTSVTIGADGLGLVSYRDAGNGNLKVAHCTNVSCTSATNSTLDSIGTVGINTSVMVGADGLGLISYFDLTNGDLKVAHCDDVTCTSATRSTIDSAGIVGSFSSVTVGADGLGLVSYRDTTHGTLKVAHCDNVDCTTATSAAIGGGFSVGTFTSVTVGADGRGLVSYWDYGNGDLKVAHCDDVACTTATSSTIDSAGNVGSYTSITIGADGLGLISYHDETNADLKVAHCANVPCTSATSSTLDNGGEVGSHTSVTIGGDGLGLISYQDQTNGTLKVAHCADVACAAVTRSTIDSAGFVGSYTSVTVGTDGLGLVSYMDDTNSDLKVAHLSNLFGVPYFRRR
jgi:hypothetical protein